MRECPYCDYDWPQQGGYHTNRYGDFRPCEKKVEEDMKDLKVKLEKVGKIMEV